jgi:hypothetical protein
MGTMASLAAYSPLIGVPYEFSRSPANALTHTAERCFVDMRVTYAVLSVAD